MKYRPIVYNGGKPTNYGALTDFSKGLNALFGDPTGRTVSRRTAQGFIRAFETDITEDDAEHIVHGGMIAAAGLLCSDDDTAKFFGALLTVGLVAVYQQG